jgi:4'-phosphopantetheinyl transferase
MWEKVKSLRVGLSRPDRVEQACLCWVGEGELDDVARRPEMVLDREELARYRELELRGPRQDLLLGRLVAKSAIAGLMNVEAREVRIQKGVFGQPLAACGSRNVPGVSLSHCRGGAVALAFPTGHPMGVDVEDLAPDTAAGEVGLDARERALLQSVNLDSPIGYRAVWSMRESLTKTLLVGLSAPIEIAAIKSLESNAPGEYASTYRNFSQYRCVSWLGPRAVLSLCLPRKTALRWPAEQSFALVVAG